MKLRAKSKYFFEGDIISHHLWGQREINIEFLNLAQPLTVVSRVIDTFQSRVSTFDELRF